MALDSVRSLVSRRPGWVVAAWLLVAVAVGLGSPSLSRLAAEGQAQVLAEGAEGHRAAHSRSPPCTAPAG